MKYIDLMKTNAYQQLYRKPPLELISMKPVAYNNGVPQITWKNEEVNKINLIED